MKNKKGCILSALICLFIFGVSIPLFMTNHKKIKADTLNDLTGTTWTINSTPSLTPRFALNQNNITFTCNNVQYTELYVGYIPELDPESDIWFYSDSTSYIQVYSQPNWLSETYRTITITGGTGATNSTFISWLQNNATQQTAPTGTEITHQFWGSLYAFVMTDNQSIYDENISYQVLYNQYTDDYNEETLTGLAFTGVLSSDDKSYILSIDGSLITTLFVGESNTLPNTMWLKFTIGDYMDNELYDFLDRYGVWFDDADVYIAGSNMGQIEAFDRGRAYGQQENLEYSNLISTIFNNLSSILNIQVFPHITIALLIGLPLLLGVFIIIIKILRG